MLLLLLLLTHLLLGIIQVATFHFFSLSNVLYVVCYVYHLLYVYSKLVTVIIGRTFSVFTVDENRANICQYVAGPTML